MYQTRPVPQPVSELTVTCAGGLNILTAERLRDRLVPLRCEVGLMHGDQRAVGVHILELVALDVAPGSKITYEVSGTDAVEASRAIQDVLNPSPTHESAVLQAPLGDWRDGYFVG